MADRTFVFENDLRDGKRVKAIILRCACEGCNNREVLYTDAFRSPPNKAWTAKHFINKGWAVGRTPQKDFCPDHNSRAARRQPKQETETMPTPTPATAAAEPRSMTRDERRIIHAALQDVYIDDVGYTVGSTDISVATSLGVPVAWIAEVREQFFGDAGSNPEIENFTSQVKLLTGVQEILEHDLQVTVEALSSLQERVRKVREDIATLNTTAARVDAAINKKGKR